MLEEMIKRISKNLIKLPSSIDTSSIAGQTKVRKYATDLSTSASYYSAIFFVLIIVLYLQFVMFVTLKLPFSVIE